jgi:2-keto-3-deoxy-L-rhamnonate aldolase RhmA
VVEAAAARTGTVMGIFVSDPDAAQRYLEAGCRYLAVGGDITFLGNAANACALVLRDRLTQMRSGG